MKDEFYIVDRIEGQYVIIENSQGKVSNLDCKFIIGNFSEGSVLVNDGVNFVEDRRLTNERKEYIDRLTKDMWK